MGISAIEGRSALASIMMMTTITTIIPITAIGGGNIVTGAITAVIISTPVTIIGAIDEGPLTSAGVLAALAGGNAPVVCSALLSRS
jgi:hypothetical protein